MRTSLVRPFFPADIGQKTDKRVIHPRTTVIARSLWPRCNFRGRMVAERICASSEFSSYPSGSRVKGRRIMVSRGLG